MKMLSVAIMRTLLLVLLAISCLLLASCNKEKKRAEFCADSQSVCISKCAEKCAQEKAQAWGVRNGGRYTAEVKAKYKEKCRKRKCKPKCHRNCPPAFYTNQRIKAKQEARKKKVKRAENFGDKVNRVLYQ